MKKNPFFFIITSVILSLLVIFVLVVHYYNNQPKAGGFTRALKSGIIVKKDSLDIGYSYYLAGLTAENIYLGHGQRKTHLLKSSYDFHDTTWFQVEIPKDWSRSELRVDSPYVYSMDGTIPGVLYAKLPSMEMQSVELGNTYFSSMILTSPQSLILKVFDGRQNQEVLTRIISGMSQHGYSSGILEMQRDEGLFSLKGQLEFEPKSRRLLYTYFYRNQFISLDTGLNILYKGNTIDTISTTKVDVVKIASTDSTDTYTPSKPPLRVNRSSSLTAEWIFVNSALKADNEEKEIFKQNSVIDVYAVDDGAYQFSFYVPDFQQQKLSDFMVHENILVAVFANYICTYEIEFY